MSRTSIRLGVVMDPIGSIHFKKDSTLAMLLEAQRRGYTLHYFEPRDLYLNGAEARGVARDLRVQLDPQHWYELGEAQHIALSQLDVILMRKDPPFDMDYIFSTYILEMAEQAGVLVVNRPASLRDWNEKLAALQFPQCISPSVVSCRYDILKAFIAEHRDTILKPLDSMGGGSIFRVTATDPNLNVILETLTRQQQRQIMAQRFIPEISAGDKRILLINGVPVPYALARIPAQGETRGNLAAGGRGEGVALSERDNWICTQVGPELRKRGLLFVGLDVIGDYLTEINVTSPTCIRELDSIYNLNISATLLDAVEQHLHTNNALEL
ncbi:MAG: glutathione synthase [Gammaproteobacteria bacterium]|nr:glutathione synthase [Gammaproteobacteria bacterium]